MAYTSVKALFTAICNAIREKDGTTELIEHQDIPERIIAITARLQSKTVDPSKAQQTVSPDSGYDGLSQVVIDAIPAAYIIPSGTLAILENGTKDVANYANVNVNVPTSPSGNTDNNCEAYLVDVTDPTVSFKRTDGTLKAWGYAYVTSSSGWTTTTTVYAFAGDKYYKSATYGSPTSTSLTLGESGGKLTGLPTLTGGELLITKGI